MGAGANSWGGSFESQTAEDVVEAVNTICAHGVKVLDCSVLEVDRSTGPMI